MGSTSAPPALDPHGRLNFAVAFFRKQSTFKKFIKFEDPSSKHPRFAVAHHVGDWRARHFCGAEPLPAMHQKRAWKNFGRGQIMRVLYWEFSLTSVVLYRSLFGVLYGTLQF